MLDRIVGYDVSALVWSQARLRPLGRARAVGGAAPHRRPRARDRGLRPRGVLERRRRRSRRQGRPTLRRQARLAPTARSSRSRTASTAAARARRSRERRATASPRSRAREQKRNAPAPYTTSQAPAGRDELPALRHQAHDADRAGALRGHRSQARRRPGRPHHVHAYRLDARQRRRHHRGARRASTKLYGKEFVPDEAQRLQVEEERAGRPRGHPPDVASSIHPDAIKKHLKDEQYKLYKLIWNRFVASQMTPAVYDQTSVDIEATPRAAGAAPRGATACAPAGASSSSPAGSRSTEGQREFAGEDEADGAGAPTARGARRDGAAGEGADAPPRRSRRTTRGARSPSSPRARRSRSSTPPGVLTEQKFTQPPAALQRRLAGARAGEARHRPPVAPTPRSSARCRRATTSRSSRAAASSPPLLGKFVVDGLVAIEPRLHGPELHRQDGGGARRGRRRQARSASQLLKRFYKRFREQLDKSKKLASLEARAREDRHHLRRVRRA